MSHNSFGHMFRITTFGREPRAGDRLRRRWLPARHPARRGRNPAMARQARPGQSRFTTQRREDDLVRILSGILRGRAHAEPVTTGTPIALLIENTDQRSKDYAEIRDKFRPGHADYTYQAKYGLRDYRGGGRSSARETAARVAAGAIARKVISRRRDPRRPRPDRPTPDRPQPTGTGTGVERNPFFTPDAHGHCRTGRTISKRAQARLLSRRRHRDRGERRARRAGARPSMASSTRTSPRRMMSINAVKGVEIGSGFAAAALIGRGECRRDPHARMASPNSCRNNAGGILGGISTGQDIVVRFAVKPTSSILTRRAPSTVARRGNRDLDQGPSRPLRRHPRRSGRRGDDGAGACRSFPAPSRADRLTGAVEHQRVSTGTPARSWAVTSPFSWNRPQVFLQIARIIGLVEICRERLEHAVEVRRVAESAANP